MRESTHHGPEPRLGLTFSQAGDGTVSWHQPVADQFVDPSGRFATGGLAVLVDSGLGAENHRRRPEGMWTVTTELRLDLLARPREGSTGLGVRTDHLGDDGHCLTTRGDVLDDDGEVVAAGLVKSMEIAGVVDPDDYDDEPPWPSALAPGTLAEVLCLTLNRHDDGPAGTRAVEAVIALEPALANPLGNLHGGVFAAVAEVAGAAVFPHEREVSSSSLDVRYVRQIPLVGPVTVRAEALHDGRSWGIAQAVTRDERGRVCAVASVTVYGRR
ncbi:MAG: PaaI family thioesterase [Dietzia sp.]